MEDLNSLKQRLAEQYPGWHFWRANSGTGDLMATRKAHITDELMLQGLARTLPKGVGTDIDLEAQLAAQASLETELLAQVTS